MMGLNKPTNRKIIHQRHIQCNGYLRDDGLWDIEAHLTDDKGYTFPTLHRGTLQPGELVHELWLRLTLTDKLIIEDVEASMPVTPFNICKEVEPNFKQLVGLKIGKGWIKQVHQRIGGINGCSHLVELLRPMATTAIQTILPYRTFGEDGRFPMNDGLLNSCHSFSDQHTIIAEFWPEKYQGQELINIKHEKKHEPH